MPKAKTVTVELSYRDLRMAVGSLYYTAKDMLRGAPPGGLNVFNAVALDYMGLVTRLDGLLPELRDQEGEEQAGHCEKCPCPDPEEPITVVSRMANPITCDCICHGGA